MIKTQIAFELEVLYKHGFFSDLDYFLAKSMAVVFNAKDPVVIASCALISKLLFEGHICLDMPALAGTQKPISEAGHVFLKYPETDTWICSLKNSLLVSDNIHTPLVLDPGLKLYLAKYFDFQNRLTDNIAKRVTFSRPPMDEALVDEIIKIFFPSCDEHHQPQKRAVKNALIKQFTIISGGPGTGKTFVINIIRKALSLYTKKTGQAEYKMMCVAPTGKASSRMEGGLTIHSALKPLINRPGFYHNKTNSLNKDVVIIDEASMVDLPLLVRLLEAAPLESRVIMTGDKHQLTSIQAGAVFSDLCAVNGLSSNMVLLNHNFRSRGQTGIEKLSKAINEMDVPGFESLLLSRENPDLIFEGYTNKESVNRIFQQYIETEYRSFGEAEKGEDALNKLDEFRILCAHNKGEYGTLQINHICEKILRSSHNSGIEKKPFIRPIMVNTNDYGKGLFNGDTGVALEKKGEVTAFFKNLDNRIKPYRYSDLPSHDTAFAITIHKSQGSEFNTVLMVIPNRFSPVVTKQLLYTGVTRARKKVILFGDLDVLKAAIRMNVKRYSGIEESLEKNLRK